MIFHIIGQKNIFLMIKVLLLTGKMISRSLSEMGKNFLERDA